MFSGNLGRVGSAPTLWTPKAITTELWYDAEDLTTFTYSSSNVVSQWNDKSGNDRHLTQSSTSLQPTHVNTEINSKYTVSFDGSNDYMLSTIPTTLATRTFAVFWVFKHLGAGSPAGNYYPTLSPVKSTGRDDGAFHYVKSNGTGAAYPYASASPTWGNYDGAGTYSTGVINILQFSAENTAWRLYRNGTQEGTYPVSGNPNNDIDRFWVGGQSSFTRRAKASIAEIIWIPSTYTGSDKQKVEGYLAHKWSLTGNLASNHPYKTTPPYL